MIGAGICGAPREDLVMDRPLLLVAGDPRTLRVLDVNLRSAGFPVDAATTGSEAWARIESGPPAMLIADADIAGINGFELCARLRRLPGGAQIPCILLVPDHALDQKLRSLEAGADDYIVKPVYVKEVLARVRALVQRKHRDGLGAMGEEGHSSPLDVGGRNFAGDLNEIAVVDLVQLCEGSRRSGLIHVRGETGAVGSVYFRRGRIVDAGVGHLTGLDALSRLFAWTRGAFEVEWKNIRRNDVIGRPTADLVIDGMQRLDEWNRLSRGFAQPEAIFEVDHGVLAERLAEIPDEANEVLRLCDGVRTLRQVIEDSTMPDLEALTALIRLDAEGIIYDIANKAAPEPSVHQDRLRDWLRAESSPVPSLIPSSSGSAETLTDSSGGVGPPRRRTAPGLGQGAPANLAPENQLPEDSGKRQQEAIPQAPAEPANVIKFPTFEDPIRRIPMPAPAPSDVPETAAEGLAVARQPGAAWTTPVDPSAELPSVELPPAELPSVNREPSQGRPAHAEVPAPVIADPRSSPHVPEAAVRAPGTMSRTHRGFGAPVSTEPGPDIATPVAALDHGRGGYLPSADRSGRLEGGIAEPWERTRQPPGAALLQPPVAVGENGGAGAADATMIPKFPDEDISRGEALDELGLPSRWRALWFLAAAALLGGVAAAVVHRWHSAHVSAGVVPAPQSLPKVEPLADVSHEAPVKAEPERQAPASGPPAIVLPEVAAQEHPSGSSPVQVGGAGGGGFLGSARVVPDGAKTGTARVRGTQPVEPPDAKSPTGRAGLAPAEVLGTRSGEASPPPRSLPETRPSIPTGVPASVRGSAASSNGVPSSSRQLEECRAAFTRNRLREALAACGAAVTANPHSAEALALLAHTELNRGRLSRAAELAGRALAVDPNVADAYVIIGGVRQDSGQNAEAKAAYRRYLQLAPRGRYAEDLRSIVNSL